MVDTFSIKDVRKAKEALEMELSVALTLFSKKYDIKIDDLTHRITNIDCVNGMSISDVRVWVDLKL